MDKKKFFYWLVGILLFAMVFAPIVYKRHNSLNNNGVEGVCKLIKIKEMAKGTLTRQTVAFIEYTVDGEKFKETTDAHNNTSVGSCYKMFYVPETPKVFEVDFTKVVSCDSFEK